MHNNLHTNYNHSAIQATYISLYASLTRGSIIIKRISTELLINGDRRRKPWNVYEKVKNIILNIRMTFYQRNHPSKTL